MPGWIDRPESDQCCPDSPGPVAGAEQIARLNAKPPPPDGVDHFPKNELLPPKKEPLDNACGQQHGYSVTRTTGRADADLASMSAALAIKKGAIPVGTIVGSVQGLRDYRLKAITGQVFYLYDDPSNGDDQHTVIRLRSDLSGGLVNEARDALKQILGRHIPPAAPPPPQP